MRPDAEPADASRVGFANIICLKVDAPVTADERQKLKALQDGLDRYELHGDVGRMVYLALENATDESDPAAAAREQAPRRRRRRTGLGWLRDAFLGIWRRD